MRRGKLAFAAMLMFSVAACGAPRPPIEDTAQSAPLTPVVPEDVVEKAGPSAERLALLARYNLKEKAQIDTLKGLKADDIRLIMGQPDFKRVDDGVEIWQYRASQCIIDLFVYYQEDNWQVRHSEIRGIQLDQAPEKTCFMDTLLKG